MMVYIILLLLLISILISARNTCNFPEPAKDFDPKKYEGKWYEIGKVQTKGGAFFERKCVCTQLDVTLNNYFPFDGTAENECREKTVDGKWSNVTGTLTDSDVPGRWLETIYGSPVNYTVIYMDDDYSIEYDCGSSLGITNYCIHVLSRLPTMPQAKFDELMTFAQDYLQLNPQNLETEMTLQEGCTENTDNMCCSECTVEGEEKFWSIDDRFNQCGEACFKPEDYDKFHKFEKNLLPAGNTNTPCCDNGYCMYKQTTSHGPEGSNLEMTFDMYDK